MIINIIDKTPDTSTLELMEFEDVSGKVLLTKGWRA